MLGSAEVITHTMSETVENHPGMQKIGESRAHGLLESHLANCHAKLLQREPALESELVCLQQDGEQACVWVLRGGVDYLLGEGGADRLEEESASKVFDTQMYNAKKGVVQNKHPRSNNCYAEEAQAADLPNGRGTVIAFGDAPRMKELRGKLHLLLEHEFTARLNAESNRYNTKKRKYGISWHGDVERKVVVACRLGRASEEMPIMFQWYRKDLPVSEAVEIRVGHGDIYVMSDKAVGYDWRCSSKTTLRHATGTQAEARKVGQKSKRMLASAKRQNKA